MPPSVIGQLVGALVISFLIVRAMLWTVRRVLNPVGRVLYAYGMSLAFALLVASYSFGLVGALANYGLPITLFASIELLRARRAKTTEPTDNSSLRVNRAAIVAVINSVSERFEPWFFLGGGLLVAFGLPARWKQALHGSSWGARPVLVLGLICISMGSLQLGIRLFVGGLKTTGFTRPLGQMVIATLLNAVLAVGLAVCALLIGEKWNAGDPTSAAWDGWTLAIAAVLLVGQGAVLPLYSWWGWSGDRDRDKFVDDVANVLKGTEGARKGSELAAPTAPPDETRKPSLN